MSRNEAQLKMLFYDLQIHTPTHVTKQKRLPNAYYFSCSVVHLILTRLLFVTLILLNCQHISYKLKLSVFTPQAKLSLFKIHGSSHGCTPVKLITEIGVEES